MDAVVIQDLSKTFKADWPGQPVVKALDGLSLSVRAGEAYGILGPNGAGKTTLIKILVGLMRPSKGRISIFGQDVEDISVRRRIGFLPESPYFYQYLTGEEFLMFFGELAEVGRSRLHRRTDDLLRELGLEEARSRQLRNFSKGMLQRIGLAQALIHDPDLVILDEPMSGLDPVGRKQVREVILRLRGCGKTVFFSTHIIPDIEMLCDRVGIIIRGSLCVEGLVEDLVNRNASRGVEVVCEGVQSDQTDRLEELASRMVQRGRQCQLVLPDTDHLDEVLAVVRRHGGRLVSVTPQRSSLEDLFLEHIEKAIGPSAHTH